MTPNDDSLGEAVGKSTQQLIRIDPQDFISGPSERCPNCGKEELGTLYVNNNLQMQRCRECLGTTSRPLPLLSKKVVYLDQHVLSEIAKQLDPVWRTSKRKVAPFWVTCFDTLERLFKLQLIVCPASPMHTKESVSLPDYAGVLRTLYEHLSGEVGLESALGVYEIQLHHALRAFLAKEMSDFGPVQRSDVVHGELDQWNDRLRISVHWPIADPTADSEREVRERVGAAFAKTHAQWATEKKSFETSYQEVRCHMGQVLWAKYLEYLRVIDGYQRGEQPLTEDVWNPLREVIVVRGLLSVLLEHDADSVSAHRTLIEFLRSEHATRVPYNEISALLMAALARRAAMGQKKPPGRGMWNDISTIAAYLPYCDAMFVDNECAELLREGPLNTRISYRTRIFSRRTGEEFLEYLRQIERVAGAEHMMLVEAVYGPSWLQPYREVLQYTREREGRPT